MKKTLALVVFLASCGPTAAHSCFNRQPYTKQLRRGSHSSPPIEFQYESRVERYGNPLLQTYVWCIGASSTNQNVVSFRWGNNVHDDIYLSALVPPGKAIQRDQDDTTKQIFSNGKISFARKNRPPYSVIQVDTISNRRLGRYEQINGKIIFAQTRGFDEFKDQNGMLQLDRLSQNNELFRRFLAERPKVRIGGSMTFFVPVNEEVFQRYDSSNYVYKASDFIELEAYIRSDLFLKEPIASGNVGIYYNIGMEAHNSSFSNSPSRDEVILENLRKQRRLSISIEVRDHAQGPLQEFKSVAIFEKLKTQFYDLNKSSIQFVPATTTIRWGGEKIIAKFTTNIMYPGK